MHTKSDPFWRILNRKNLKNYIHDPGLGKHVPLYFYDMWNPLKM